MGKYKLKGSSSSSSEKGEVKYRSHTQEFMRFFESHKRLCDEIAGLKYHTIGKIEDSKKLLITRMNFELGIKRLNSFLIDFLHYIDEPAKVDDVMTKFYILESKFFNDDKYKSFVKKGGSLTPSQEIEFNKRYIHYLLESFKVAFVMSKYLQKSLNIASKEIVKSIQFVNYDSFFSNLSEYREEVANDLSNLNFETFFDNFKKLLGYFYTYRYLIGARIQKHVDELLGLIYDYIVLDDTVKTILKLRSGESLTEGKRKDIRLEFVTLRDAFNKVYFLCNFSLSMKNILPKSKKEILVDNTLI